ncbi:MAG: RHS repeat-associated core domain-containing protein [Opitutia bacterium]
MTTDAMGSVTSVLSSTGEVLERRSYHAFGQMTCMLPDGTPVATSPTGLKVGFHGQLMDQLTGMYQMGYRWYSPVLGRWASRDPIGLEGGVNVYRAFRNDSTGWKDPWGKLDARAIVVMSFDGRGLPKCRLTITADDCHEMEDYAASSTGAYLSIYSMRQGNKVGGGFLDYSFDAGFYARIDCGHGGPGDVPVYPLNAYSGAAIDAPYGRGASYGMTVNYNKHIGLTVLGTTSAYWDGWYAYYGNDANMAPSFVPQSLTSDKSWTGTGGVGFSDGIRKFEISYMAFTAMPQGHDSNRPFGDSPAGYYLSNESLNRNGWLLSAGGMGDSVGVYIPAANWSNLQQALHDRLWLNPDGSIKAQNPADPLPYRFHFPSDPGWEWFIRHRHDHKR